MSQEKLEENRKQIIQQMETLHERLRQNPKNYSAMYSLAERHFWLDEFRKSYELCKKLADLGAEQVVVYTLGAQAGIKAGLYKDVVKIINKGLKKFPDEYNLLISLATALNKDKQHQKAEEIFEKARQLNPDNPISYVAMGNYYTSIGQVDQALNVLEEGLEKFPDAVVILNNIGALYNKLEDYIQASEYYIKALRLKPENPDCLVNLGATFERMKKVTIAQQFFEQALALNPNHSLALCCKANSMCNHGLAQEAIPLYRKGLELSREDAEVQNSTYIVHYSNIVFYQHYVPYLSKEEIFDDIINWQKELCSDVQEKPSVSFDNKPDKKKKLRIGLISKGFNVHPVGQMIYAALENLNKDDFELYCYTELPEDKKDYLTEKIYSLMAKTTVVANEVNHILVEKMREDELDILIEMTGHSEGGRRLQLIAERVAPVQVKWVGGLFNTTGVPQMDWLLSDNIETPEGVDDWYTEKIYRMPDDYIVYYPPYYAPRVLDLPAKKNGFVTFGNLNNLAKTNSYSIEIWSKILHAVPNSRMLLKGSKMHEDFVQDHLYKAFEAHGINRDRVIIEGGEQHQQFMHVYNRIDIALDPHPYTGGLTTCEALWMGVPVVTLPGETFAGRHSATHLANANLSQFIAQDEQDYIDIALKWANDLDELENLRAGLREHVSKTPLVDGPRFAKNLEKAMRHMWSEWCDIKINALEETEAPITSKNKKR